MHKLLILLHSVAFCCVHTAPLPEPQDFQTGALMLMGQVKEVFDNGAATRDQKEFEFMGAKVSNDMAFGFGDALKMPGRRRRREVEPPAMGADNSLSYDDSDYILPNSHELCAPPFVDPEESFDNEERKKRAARRSSSQSSSSDSSSNSSSSSSSSSSESD